MINRTTWQGFLHTSALRGCSRYRTLARLMLLTCLGTVPVSASEVVAAPTDDEDHKIRLSAQYYADSSCLMSIDRQIRSGRTVIDASVDEAGSRMMIHCDLDAGGRLTLLARGDSLSIGNRIALLSDRQLQAGDTGMLAWFIEDFNHGDESTLSADAPRRYLHSGHVLMRSSPIVAIAGSALHTDSLGFANLEGQLDAVATTPSTRAQPPGADSATAKQ